ncbi:MAG: hypothetical protein A2Z34_01045 [Planctomycetes bacterium RBG_16_59_8]|nr:MAG: hypothetical protein A2Z34_01045 [Planctomycetes bacterium RBG_16_59_8]
MRRSAAGFTLIEILVVLLVISILASLVLVSVVSSVDTSRITSTRTMIEQLNASVGRYETIYRDFPPTSLRRRGIAMPNGVNTGIESLLVCLMSKEKGGPYYTPSEESLSNHDKDRLAKTPPDWYFGDADLREICDMWGQPFVYFHFRDYEKPENDIANYTFGEQSAVCKPQKSEKTKMHHRPGKFQIWSIGPNGENENGGGDDIPNW